MTAAGGDTRVEPDWTPVQAIAGKLLENGDRLADELLARQHRTVPGLDGSLGPDDTRAHARWLIRAFLHGVSERRPPTAEQVARCEAYGALRAKHGIAVSAVVQGYHDAHRELWQRIICDIITRPGVEPALLAGTFGHALHWLHITVEAVSRGFQSQAADNRSARERATHQLVMLLESGETSGDRVCSLAAGLGFDPDGSFVAVHGHPPGGPAECPDADPLPGTRLIQSAEVAAALGPPAPGERWGIGAERPRLSGARRSITDAKLAHAALPDRGGRLDFTGSWSLCLPHAHREAIDPLIDAAREVARARPHLLEAVVAFADARFSVSAAARALMIHPNTLSYRLDQWHKHTRLDPRSVSGLAQSLYLAR
jgi:hypothetical protein